MDTKNLIKNVLTYKNFIDWTSKRERESDNIKRRKCWQSKALLGIHTFLLLINLKIHDLHAFDQCRSEDFEKQKATQS